MNILVAHSRYLSGPVSGENRVVDDEVELLRSAGHTVTLWDPSVSGGRSLQLTRTALETVWAPRRDRQLQRIVMETAPDVLHVHNLFPALSPVVLRTAARLRLPSVITLHNFRLMCLPATFLRDGRICEDCMGRLPWPGVVHACYRGSRTASAVIASSLSLHRGIGTFRLPARFLAVSTFLRQKYVEAGYPADRIEVKSNFAWPTERRSGPGDHILFLGRLSMEKGVRLLAAAAERARIPLSIVGEGPDATYIRNSSTTVDLRDPVAPAEVPKLFARARALVVPSICYEGQPRSILEAFAAGVPVIATRIGGLPEVVVHEETGLLVEPNDPNGLADALTRMMDDDLSLALGTAAYEVWRERFAPETGLGALESAYARVTT